MHNRDLEKEHEIVSGMELFWSGVKAAEFTLWRVSSKSPPRLSHRWMREIRETMSINVLSHLGQKIVGLALVAPQLNKWCSNCGCLWTSGWSYVLKYKYAHINAVAEPPMRWGHEQIVLTQTSYVYDKAAIKGCHRFSTAVSTVSACLRWLHFTYGWGQLN